MAQPLTDAINALTTYANTVTGASDTTLSDAVATLASGYGGGGSNREAEILSGSLSGAYENTEVTSLRNNALNECTHVTSISLPALTTAGNSAIRNCTSLTTVNLPELTSTGTYCFSNDTQLNNVTLPKLGTINNNVFEGCTGMTSASFPMATQINNSGLRNNRFTTIVLPAVTKVDTYGISYNPNLTAVDFPVLAQLTGGSAFINDSSLTAVIIRTGTMATLSNTNHFNNTPFASNGSGGTLYVPSALVSSYQSASNWSTILGYATNSIQAIEGSQYENYYADGTPIE